MLSTGFIVLGTFVGVALITGCGGVDAPQPGAGAGDAKVAGPAEGKENDPQADSDAAHNLHGWWCTEHGVPEEECARCDISLIARFKEKKDWCDQHDRPASQCFICDASRFDKFAARYEAKFGKRPPMPTE
jgi:hypothetical protein